MHLGPVVVNRVHPTSPRGDRPVPADGRALISWLGRRDRRGVEELAALLGGSHPLVEIPLQPDEPSDLESLAKLGASLEAALTAFP